MLHYQVALQSLSPPMIPQLPLLHPIKSILTIFQAYHLNSYSHPLMILHLALHHHKLHSLLNNNNLK